MFIYIYIYRKEDGIYQLINLSTTKLNNTDNIKQKEQVNKTKYKDYYSENVSWIKLSSLKILL